MQEQKHTGTGDNIAGDKTEIERQINSKNYFENLIINYNGVEIKRYLTNQPFFPIIFEGRDTDIEKIHEKLFGAQNSLLLVNGEGGMGKTSVAAKYWEKYAQAYKHLAWVFAENNMRDALLNIAPKLQIQFPQTMEADDRFSELLTALTNLDAPCLLVIDNANDGDDLARYYNAIASCKNFHVLFTSRITEFENAVPYKIEPLKPEETIKVFKKHYPKHRTDDNNLLLQLREAVGGNTLVMELMAKNLHEININEIFYSLNDLVNDFKNLGLLHISQEEKISIPEKGKHHAFIKIEPTRLIAALYDEMETIKPLTDGEKQILSNLSVLPAENISYEMLKTLLTPDNARTFSKTLTGLAQRGWIEKSYSDETTQYKISPVVQHITREKNKEVLYNHNESMLENLIQKLNYEVGTGNLININYDDASLFVHFAEFIIKNLKRNSDLLAILIETIGSFYETIGNLPKSLNFFEYHLLSQESLNSAFPNDLATQKGLSISYFKIAGIYFELGKLDNAMYYLEKEIKLINELRTKNPEDIYLLHSLAVTFCKMGDIFRATGDYHNSLEFYKQYNRIEKKINDYQFNFYDFQHNLAVSFCCLGIAYQDLYDWEQALTSFKEYNRLSKELWVNNPESVDFKYNNAISCQYLGSAYDILGYNENAHKFYNEYISLVTELYKAYPGNLDNV